MYREIEKEREKEREKREKTKFVFVFFSEKKLTLVKKIKKKFPSTRVGVPCHPGVRVPI